ncbi:unnamed protein product, partial [Iphiclides podalirius]
MFSYDVKFLTSDDLLYLKSGDLKSFKYETKKRVEETVYEAGKRNYCERRGGYWRIPKSSQLRQLESTLRDRIIVTCEWTNESFATLIFSSGVIAYITIKPDTLDVTRILFDKYCIGKLSGQCVTGAIFCKTHLLFTHAERTATLFTFGKSIENGSHPCRLSDRDPHIQSLELGGARRAERRVSWCADSSGVKVLLWSAANAEPAPWSPVLEDLANLHLYQIQGQQVTLIAFHQLENEVLCAELSQNNDNVVHIVEQSASHKSGVTLEWQLRVAPTGGGAAPLGACCSRARASLPSPVRIARRSACGRRLLAACIDGTLHVLHSAAGHTHTTRAGFIPTDVRWAGELVVAVEEAGRLQCFDRALSLLHHHTKCIDLVSHFRDTRRMQMLATRGMRCGPVILAMFSGGPLTLLHITHPRLITAWVRAERTSNAVALLRAMDWEGEGVECLRAMGELVHGALRGGGGGGGGRRLRRRRSVLHDLARKFFHHLLRRGRIEKALSLAVDLAAWDLFADVRWAAMRASQPHLVREAARAARHYAHAHESECSESCSQCSSRSSSESDEELSGYSGTARTTPPPLPRVAPPPQPTVLPVPITQTEPTSTLSIRPNLHQYLERDSTIWSTEHSADRAHEPEPFKQTINPPPVKWQSVDSMLLNYRKQLNGSSSEVARSRVFDAIPRIQDEKINQPQFKQVFQVDSKEATPNVNYRYNNSIGSGANGRIYKHDSTWASKTGERNKVKFSNTVTIAVVSEPPPSPDAARELAASLPLCAPHNYLAAFAPAPAAAPAPRQPPHADNPVPQVPKIKVVHFGMV